MHISNKVYVVLILRLSEIRKTVIKLMDIARVIKARRTVHGNIISAINILGDPGTASRDDVFLSLAREYCIVLTSSFEVPEHVL